MPDSRFIWMGSSGCFLPFLIIFNLFFGRFIFSSIRLWLGVEAVLIIIFVFSVRAMTRKILQQFGRQAPDFSSAEKNRSRQVRAGGKVIDIQGQAVEEEEKRT